MHARPGAPSVGAGRHVRGTAQTLNPEPRRGRAGREQTRGPCRGGPVRTRERRAPSRRRSFLASSSTRACRRQAGRLAGRQAGRQAGARRRCSQVGDSARHARARRAGPETQRRPGGSRSSSRSLPWSPGQVTSPPRSFSRPAHALGAAGSEWVGRATSGLLGAPGIPGPVGGCSTRASLPAPARVSFHGAQPWGGDSPALRAGTRR